MTISFADSGGVRIAWESIGEPDKPPLLLVMGHAYPRTMWDRNLAALTAIRHVISMDNRGSGESAAPRGDYSVEQMAADSIAVLDAAGIDKADVYGVSMGGLIAQEIALIAPERVQNLILGCTASTQPFTPPGRLDAWFYYLPKPLLAIALTRSMYGPAGDRGRVKQDLKTLRRAKFSARGCHAQSIAIAAYTSRPTEIKTRTLVIHGDEDAIIPVERARALAQAIDGAELVVLPGCGHNYNCDAPVRADAAVTAFLSS